MRELIGPETAFDEMAAQVLPVSAPPVTLPLRRCAGHVLACDLASDTDMPPFDRSAMDGYAVSGASSSYRLLDPVHAGQVPREDVGPGTAVPIMTGAPVPPGADRVVMVERTCVSEDGATLRMTSGLPPEGANICRRGEDITQGQIVLPSGTLIGARHLGIASMAGATDLPVLPLPVVSLVSTGTEVVAPGTGLGPGLVRDANLPLMQSLCMESGFQWAEAMHVADDRHALAERFSELLDRPSDMLIVAGGVSMGDRDLVPGVLEELGVRIVFHGVAQKPGKPLLFGIYSDRKPVFGLPGNPVSVMVCMEEYVIPALRKRSGMKSFRKRSFEGSVAARAEGVGSGRTHYLRAEAVMSGSGQWLLTVPASSGSGDLMSTSKTNCLAILPPGPAVLGPGERLEFHLYARHGGDVSFA